MTAPNAILNGGCCCSSPTDCHGIPQSPACIWVGNVRTASALSYIYDLDFRSADVQLPAIRRDGNTKKLMELSPEEAEAGEYEGSPMRLVFSSGYCCDPDTAQHFIRPVSLINGKIATDSIPDLTGNYVIVYLEVLECPHPAEPLPQILSLYYNDPIFKKPTNCPPQTVCADTDDPIPMTSIENLRSLLPSRRGNLNQCGHILVFYETTGIMGVCDKNLWHLTAQDGNQLPTQNNSTYDNNHTVKYCFDLDKRLTTQPTFDESKNVYAGEYGRCFKPSAGAYTRWVARRGSYPFYTGYTLTNPSVLAESTVEEVRIFDGTPGGRLAGYTATKPRVSFYIQFVPKLAIPYLMSAFGGVDKTLYGASWTFEDLVSVSIWDGVGKGNDEVIVENCSLSEDELITQTPRTTPFGTVYDYHGPVLSGKVEMSGGVARVILSESDLAIISRPRKVEGILWFRGTYNDNPEVSGYYWKTGENEYGEPKYENGYYDAYGCGSLEAAYARAEQVRDLLNAGISSAVSSITGYSAAQNGANTWEDPEINSPNGITFNSCEGGSPKITLNASGLWNVG